MTGYGGIRMKRTIEFDLTGKKAIVTGASRGLGIELATSLAEYGADVAIMATNTEKLEKAAKEIREKTGREIIPVPVNIAEEASVEEAVQKVKEVFGTIDILVNNAGIIRYGAPEEISYEDWTECLNVDVTGTWLMSKAVVNASMKEKGGRIVNIASVNSFSASPVAPVYHVSKAAVVALTKSCACAWAPYGIFVNAIGPGYMLNGEMAPDTPLDVQESIKRNVPQKKLGAYGDLSGALIYLVSDANTYTQGNTIVCDGGMILESF